MDRETLTYMLTAIGALAVVVIALWRYIESQAKLKDEILREFVEMVKRQQKMRNGDDA